MSARPLAGLTVVDLSRHLPGPFAARLLADLGARVVKIEEPESGDPLRQAPPFVRGQSTLAEHLLAAVDSVALDLKREPARQALLAGLERADVLLESFRPGTLARLDLAPERLRQRFPRLVICSLSGWGQQGPYAVRAGHDLTYQAVAGTLAEAGELPAFPAADLLGAWSAVASVLAALCERQRSGRGAWIDASLFDAAAHANVVGWAALAGDAAVEGQAGMLSGALPCYNLYRSRDGRRVALALLERKFWWRFCERVGRRDLLRRQYERGEAARQAVAELVASRDAVDWARLFVSEDLPAECVATFAEARRHPQAVARGLAAAEPEATASWRFPATFDGERPQGPRRALPALGAATRAWLAEVGSPAASLGRSSLRRRGIGRRFTWRSLLWRLASG